MTPIHVYLHVAGMNHYREIVAELAGVIDGAGLYDAAASLTACCVGEANLSNLFGQKWSVLQGSPSLIAYEYPTLDKLWRHARSEANAYYLYLHTKGVRGGSSRRLRHRASWRRYMSHYVITRWRECIDALAEHDTAGVEWMKPRRYPAPCYAGNFWWARGEYLCQLPKPEESSANRGLKHRRHGAEAWLGLGSPRAACYWNFPASTANHDAEIFHESYRKEHYPWITSP